MNIRTPMTLALGVLISGCIVQTEAGPRGDPGPPGEPGPIGPPGLPDETVVSELQTSVAKLQAQVDALQSKTDTLQSTADVLQTKVEELDSKNASLQAKVDALEAQATNPDCPIGYASAAKPFVLTNPDSVLCKKGDDEVVKVGAGAAAFWIDRYEVSIWQGTTQKFANVDDSSPAFPKNGQAIEPWVAMSVSAVTPSRYLTWLQAQAACRAGGKRLPQGEEWLAAARGTSDPDLNDGSQNTRCSTNAAAIRPTGGAGDPASTPQADGCFSDWGADDMIGNLREMTDQWYAMLVGPDIYSSWPSVDYGSDQTVGIGPSACLNGPGSGCATQLSVPIPAQFGGSWYGGTDAGLFAVAIDASPASWHEATGLRCVISR